MEDKKIEALNALYLDLAKVCMVPTPREVEMNATISSLRKENSLLRKRLEKTPNLFSKRRNLGGHFYPGCEGSDDEFRTSDCEHQCGCWMGQSRSGGPNGVDPFGICPNNPKPPRKDKLRERIEALEKYSQIDPSLSTDEIRQIVGIKEGQKSDYGGDCFGS